MRSANPEGPKGMSIKKLPQLTNFDLPERFDVIMDGERLKDWKPELDMVNLAPDGATVIEIFDAIGADPFFGGVSARYVAAQLRSAKDVVVNINSPGGSYMEGVTMFNLLAQHRGKVTVNILGQAASAASIVAMAGDEKNMAPASVLFIHNVHADVYGDRHDFAEISDLLTKLDTSLGSIYVEASGQTSRKVADMLDAETTLTAEDAVKLGFADKILAAADVTTNSRLKNEAQTIRADRMIEFALRNQFPGLTRSTFHEVKNAFRDGKPGAVITATRDAGLGELTAELRQMLVDL